MNKLVQDKDLNFSIDFFNKKLSEFSYSRLDRKNKIPNNIFTKFSLNEKRGFHLSATHFWTLIRIFPIIFGQKLNGNIYYRHYLDLIEIFFLLNATSFKEQEILQIEEKIYLYLTKFKQLYPTEKLMPKYHFMIHYGWAIRTIGPPILYSTMRFESKHSFFKTADNAIHNHINLTKSLAYKHQDLQLYYLISPNYYTSMTIGTKELISPENFNILTELLPELTLNFHKWAIYNNILYTLGDMICYEINTIFPIFGQIKHLIVSNDKIIFILNVFDTIEYLSYLRCYLIKENENASCKIIHLDKIENKLPFDLYCLNGDSCLISPKSPLK